MRRPPTLEPLEAAFRGAPGVVVRPFADQRGAVVIGPGAVAFVEVEPGRATDQSADWMCRLDLALNRPTITSLVRSEADIADVATVVGRSGPEDVR